MYLEEFTQDDFCGQGKADAQGLGVSAFVINSLIWKKKT